MPTAKEASEQTFKYSINGGPIQEEKGFRPALQAIKAQIPRFCEFITDSFFSIDVLSGESKKVPYTTRRSRKFGFIHIGVDLTEKDLTAPTDTWGTVQRTQGKKK